MRNNGGWGRAETPTTAMLLLFFYDIHGVSVFDSVYSELLMFSHLQTEKNWDIKTMFLAISIQMRCLRFEATLD